MVDHACLLQALFLDGLLLVQLADAKKVLLVRGREQLVLLQLHAGVDDNAMLELVRLHELAVRVAVELQNAQRVVAIAARDYELAAREAYRAGSRPGG